MEKLNRYENATEFYNDTILHWPSKKSPAGQWILASFDEE